jgi:hypothetical protein
MAHRVGGVVGGDARGGGVGGSGGGIKGAAQCRWRRRRSQKPRSNRSRRRRLRVARVRTGEHRHHPCAHASHEGQVHTHSPPSRRHLASLNDSELARQGVRPNAAPSKKTTKRRPSVHILLNSTCTDGRQFSD